MVPGAKKMIFFKVVPRPVGMLKQVFLGRLEPVVAHYGPWKIPKCLENRPFQDQKCVNNGSKARFSNNDLRPLGVHKQVVGANGGSTVVPGANTMVFFEVVPRSIGMLKQVSLGLFEPGVAVFGPWKIPKYLENGPFQDQNRSTTGQKCVFPTMMLDRWGCTNK